MVLVEDSRVICIDDEPFVWQKEVGIRRNRLEEKDK
jgi:hypothetical protein